MAYIYAAVMLAGAVLAGYFALRYFKSEKKQYIENQLLMLLCVASSIWSGGFALLIVQEDIHAAYTCRVIGMTGTFLYLILVQILVGCISGLERRWLILNRWIAGCGFFVFFFAVRRGETVYYKTPFGMSYYFKPGFCSTIYTLYTVLAALNIAVVIWYMITRSKVRRIRAFGRWFLAAEFLLMSGMVLDTIFPLLGRDAMPGSTLTQFWGLVALCMAVEQIDRAKVNLNNMSQFIYYSLDMPVLVYDVSHKLQIINDAAVMFFAVKGDIRKEGAPLESLFEITEKEAFSFAGIRKDIDARCRKNQVYCSLAINRIYDGFGDIIGYIILVTDLTERLRAIHKLEEAMEEAKAASNAKSTFLANMSHEIRTPMNAIIGFSELALKLPLEEQARSYIEDIRTSSNNLLSIINDILDISKIESGKMELVCGAYYAGSLLNDVYQIIYTQTARKGLAFSVNIDPSLPNQMFGDAARIRGVLINLLNNAVKYTEQGKVTLDVRVASRIPDTVRLEFRISDTGIGIRKEEQGKLFESFTQADYKLHYQVEGSGLGLAIAKGYINMMGGEIQVESTYGEGSVFTVMLEQKVVDERPLEAPEKGQNVAFGASMGNLRFGDVPVLVVDDSRINLRVAKESMKHYGLLVDTASSGAQAVDMCAEKAYAIVFMDQMMPVMGGIEAMQKIRAMGGTYASGGSSKIVVLTADAISGARERLMREGFDEYLVKPMNYKRLEQLLLDFLPDAVCEQGS